MHGMNPIKDTHTKYGILAGIGSVTRRCSRSALIMALLGVSFLSSTAFATKGGDIISPQFPARDQRPGKQSPVASATDAAGNTYITGFELPPGSGFEQFYTVKIASDGTLAWRAVYQRPNQPAKAVALAVDNSTGDVFVTGNVSGDVVTIKYPATPSPKAGSSDPKEVQESWLTTFDNGGTHNATATSMAIDSNNVYVAGAARYGGSDRFMVLAYSRADGSQAGWQIPSVATSIAGMAQGIAVNADGIAITGASSGGYFQTVRYGLGGTYVWDVIFDNPTQSNDTGLLVRIDSAGDVVATGSVSNGTHNNIHTVKYNGGAGTLIWSQTANLGEASEPDALYIDQDANPADRDHVYVSGHASIDGFNHIYTVRYKSALASPQTIWSGPGVVAGGVIFNSGDNSIDVPKSIVVDRSSDSLFVAGYTATNSNTDFLTVKYRKSTGDLLWKRTFSGVANNNDQSVGIGLDLDSGGNPFVAGYADESTPLHYYTATVDNSSKTIIEDNTTSGIWAGYYIMMTNGLNAGEFRKIASNDATSLTLALQLPNGTKAGDTHYIYDKEDHDYYVVKYDRGALNAPGKLTAAAVSNNAISLSWQDNNSVSGTDPTKFRIERCTDSVPRLTNCTAFSVLTDNITATSFTDSSGLLPDTYYYYRVTAHNVASGDTHPSNTAHAATQYLATDTPAGDHRYTYAGMAPSLLENAISIATSPTNGFPVVTGNSFFGSKGFDYYTIKLDRNLTKIWSQQYGEPQMIYDDVDTCLAIDNNGQIVVSGFSYLNNSGTDMDAIFTRKLDNAAAAATTPVADGVSAGWADQWTHQYNAPGGGDSQAIAVAAASDSSNNITLVGMGLHTPAEYGKYDIYVLRYPSNGPGTTGSPNPGYWVATPIHKMDDNRPTALAVDSAGDVIITGFIGNLPNGGTNHYRIYTAKFSGSAATAPLCPTGKVPGCLIWEQTYAGGFGNDEPNDVAVDTLGNIYVTGFATVNAQGDTAFITLKYDKDGNIQWGGPKIADNPGGDDQAVTVEVDPVDGNIVVAGDRLTDPGNHDFHVVRYSAADGTELWHKTILREGSSEDMVDMAMDRSGSVFVTGSSTDTAGAASMLTVQIDWQGNIKGNAIGYTSTATPADAKAFAIATNSFGEAFAAGYSRNADTTVSNVVIKVDGDAIQSVYPLTATPGYSTVTLNWTDNSRLEGGYQVVRRNGACPAGPANWVTPAELIAASLAAGTKTYPDSGLAESATYCYGVRAFQGSDYARWTNITVTTASSPAPTGASVTATDTTTNTVGWSSPSYQQTPTGFKINRCTGASCTGSDSGFPVAVGNVSSYIDSSACAGNTYRYQVKAYGTGWESPYTAQVNVTTLTPPSNVTYGFTATWKSEQRIDLSWTNSAPDSTGYKVQRCDGSGCSNFANIATVTPATNTTYSDTSVSANATYTYRVYPYKIATCNGGWNNGIPPALDFPTSPSTTGTATASLLGPSALTVTAPNTTQVNLVWDDRTSSETGFRIERCTGSSCTFATPDILDGTNPYRIVAAGSLGYNDTSVCNNTTYKYRIKAISDNSTGWTETSYTNATPASITTPSKPAAPGVSPNVQNESQINLTWSFGGSDHTGFHVDRCTASDCSTTDGNTVTPLPDQPSSATGYQDKNIPFSANNYYYRVTAFKSGTCEWTTSTISVGVKLTSMATSKPSSVTGSNTAATVITNCDDIRVTDSGGTVLPIYIQSRDGGSSTCGQNATGVVTKLDLAPGASGTYYLYYGNQNATATSDGNKVFVFFDDFDNNSLDTTKWDSANSIYSNMSIGSGYLNATRTSGRLLSAAKFPPVGETAPSSAGQYSGYTLEARVQNFFATQYYNGFVPAGFFNGQTDNVGFRIGKYYYDPSATPPHAFYFNNGASTQATSALAGATLNDPMIYQVRTRRSSSSSDAYLAMTDLSILTAGAPTPYWTPGIISRTVTSAPIGIGRRYDDNNGALYSNETLNASWDWIRVRKYALPAPSVSSLGSPETTGPYTVGGVAGWKYRRAFTVANSDPNALNLAAYQVNLPAFDTSGASSFPVTDHVTISWIDKTASEDGFYIYRCAGASCTPSTTPFAMIGPAFSINQSASYTDGATTANTTYCYQVAAYKGDPSNPTWKTDPSSPPVCRTTFNQQAPTNLSGTASGNQITLAWDDNTIGETSYKLERCDSADCNFTSGVTTTTIPAVSNVKIDGTVVAPVLANSTNPPHASYIDTSIGCSGTFRYRISANFLSDPGTVLGPGVATGNIVVGEVPLAPTFPAGPTYPDEQQITIAWNDANAPGVWNSYIIERCTATSGSCSTGFMQVGTVTGTRTLSYTDNTIVPGVQYGYRVITTINSGCGIVSSPASTTVFGATTGTPWTGTELYFNPTQDAPLYQTNLYRTNMYAVSKTAVEKGFILKRCLGLNCTDFSFLAALPAKNQKNIGFSTNDSTLCPGNVYMYSLSPAIYPKSMPNLTNDGGNILWMSVRPLFFSSFVADGVAQVTIPRNTAVTDGSEPKDGFADLRFYDSIAKTELKYSMQSYTATSATVWIKVGPNASSNHVYVYYGNANAAASTNSIAPGAWTYGAPNMPGDSVTLGLQVKATVGIRTAVVPKLNNVISDWTLNRSEWKPYGSNGGYASDNSQGFAQMSSLAFTLSGGAKGGYELPSVPVVPGAQYQLKAYMKTSLTTGSARCQLANTGAGYNSTVVNAVATGTSTWSESTVDTITIPGNVSTVNVRCYLDTGSNGTAWFGAVQLLKSDPLSLSATTVDESSVDLTWNDFFGTTSTGFAPIVYGSTATGYTIYSCTDGSGSNCTLVPSPAAPYVLANGTGTIYRATGLTPGTTNYFKVAAYGAGTQTCTGNGSDPANGIIWRIGSNTASAATTDGKPATPLASPLSSTSMEVSWPDKASGETAYDLYRCDNGGTCNYNTRITGNPATAAFVKARYSLDGTMTDSSGSGLNFSNSQTPVYDDGGVRTGSLWSYTSSSSSLKLDAFTVEFNFKFDQHLHTSSSILTLEPSTTAAGEQYFYISTAAATSRRFDFKISGTTVLTNVGINGENGTAFTPGKWHHVAVAKNGQSLKVYIDGTQVASTGSLPAPVTAGSYGLKLGAGSGQGQGVMKNLVYYNAAVDPTRITWIDSATCPGNSYRYKLTAYKPGWPQLGPAAGELVLSDASGSALMPAFLPPSGLAAANVQEDNRRIELSWTPANTSNPQASYLLKQCQGDSCTPGGTPTGISPASTSAYSRTGLTPETTYCYQVASYVTTTSCAAMTDANGTTHDGSGITSAYTPPVCAKTAMKSPTDLGFVLGGSSSGGSTYSTTSGTSNYPYKIHLKWSDNASDETYYVVELLVRKDTWIPVGTVSGNSFIDTVGIEPAKKYTYRVRAFRASDQAQSVASNAVSISTPAFNIPSAPDHSTCLCAPGDTACFESGTVIGPGEGWNSSVPAPPSGIWANAGNGQASIFWTAGAGAESSFIQYGTTSGVYTTTIDPAVSPRIIYSLNNGQTIYYKVGARNSSGTILSAEYSVTPAVSPPDAPTDITATAGNAQATIAWVAGDGAEASIVRYGSATGVYTAALDPAASPVTIAGLTNGQPLYYQIGARNQAGTRWSTEKNVTPAVSLVSPPTDISFTVNSNSFVVSWTPSSTYSYLKWGTSSGSYPTQYNNISSPRSVTTTGGTTVYFRVGSSPNSNGTLVSWSDEYTTRVGTPLAPTDIVATPGNGQVTLTWTPGAGATSSTVQWHLSYCGTTTTCYANTITNATSPFTITGRTNGQAVYYRVGSKNNSSTLSYYATAQNSTPTSSAPAAASPSLVQGSGNGEVRVTWPAVSGATSYSIRYGAATGTYPNRIDSASSPYTVTGLTPSTTYYFQVGSTNASGTTWSAESSMATSAMTVPSAPTGISAAPGNGRATISWTVVPFTSYSIRYGSAAGVYTTTVSAASPHVLTGLVNGQTTHYQVGASNTAGTSWSPDQVVTAVAPPAAPTGISAIAGDAQAIISWTPGTGEGAISSLLQYGASSGTYGATVDPATSPHTIPGLIDGQTVYFRIGARNLGGTTWSAESAVTPGALPVAPAAPTGISTTAGNGKVTIMWTPGTNSTSSRIRYGTVAGTYPTTINPAMSPATISSLENGQPIYLQVGASNATATTWSGESSVTPLLSAPPSAPTGISATSGDRQIVIWWTAGTDSTSSLIEYGTVSGNYTTTIDPATSPRTIGSLVNGQTVYYRVGARNGAGLTWSGEYMATPVAPPTAPTVNPAVAEDTQITISWTPGTGAGTVSSLIRYGTVSGVYSVTVDPASSPHTITGLSNGTAVYYQVGTKNEWGTTWSSQKTATPAVVAPSAPTSIYSIPGNGRATISWTKGAGSTSSDIKYGTSTGSYPSVVTSAGSPHIISGLINGTTYYFRVGAKNSAGTTWSSEEYTVTPILLPPAAPTNISATVASASTSITWISGMRTVSSVIQYGTAPGVYTTTLENSTSPKSIFGLANYTTYYYRVGGTNGSGTTWSTEYSITPIGSPGAPSGIAAIPGNAQASVTWTAGTGATSSLIRYYGTTCGSGTPTTISPALSPQIITGLPNGVNTCYQVGSRNPSGDVYSSSNYVKPVTAAPSAATNISATPGNGQMTISWTPGATSTKSLLRYGTVPGTYTTTIDPATSGQPITGLANGQTYYYRVGAYNTSGTTWSDPESNVVLATPP